MRRTMFLLGAAGAMTLLASAACSSTDDGGGGSGNTGNATTTTSTGSGSGGCDCYSCSGYIMACVAGCPAGDPRDVVCQGSLPTMVALNECICDPERGNCATQCAGTCSMSVGGAGGGGGTVSGGGTGGTVSGGGTGGVDSGSGGDSADCMPCQAAAAQNVCAGEMTACGNLKTCG
jgi:hypothetical protein